MKLAALLPVRNEDWVLGLSARVALQWCDLLVILDHASEDGTHAIIEDLLREFPRRVIAACDSNSVWDEMRHRQSLLDVARDARATHIAMVDADEILTGNLLGSIRKIVETMPPASMLQLPGYNLRGDMQRYHANGIWGNRWFSAAFASDPRLCWRGDCFHHREPMGPALSQWRPIGQGCGGVIHLWGLNERRLVAKHAAYKMVEALRWPNKSRGEIDRMYSQPFDPLANRQFEQTWRYGTAPESWWEPYEGLLDYLKADAEPWQEKMCRDLCAKHGTARFAGLDLFGVCAEAGHIITDFGVIA